MSPDELDIASLRAISHVLEQPLHPANGSGVEVLATVAILFLRAVVRAELTRRGG